MAQVTYSNTTAGGNSGASTVTTRSQAITVPSGNPGTILVAHLILRNTGTECTNITCSYNSVAMTLLRSDYYAAQEKALIYYLVDPPTGSSYNIQADWTTAVQCSLQGSVFYNVNLSNPFINTTENQTQDTSCSLGLDGVTDGLTVDWLARNATTDALTMGAGQTSIYKNSNGSGSTWWYASSYESGAGYHNMSWTFGASARVFIQQAATLIPMSVGRQFQAVWFI